MKVTITRPLCRRPVLGIVGCTVLAVVSWCLVYRGFLTPLFQFAGGGFLIGVGLFLMLTIFRPTQRVVVTDEEVRWTGVLSRCVIRFDEVGSACLRPDASNHRQLRLESKGGRELVIHAGFLNPDTEGVISLFEERLKREGISLERRPQ